MGIKTTFDIERSVALKVILTKVNECSNEQLEDMLECFDESYFRNYIVHDSFKKHQIEYMEGYVIENVNEF